MIVAALRVSACVEVPHDFLSSVLAGTAILIHTGELGGETESQMMARAGKATGRLRGLRCLWAPLRTVW